jgi:osmotically-inducible protein OsmY
MKVLVLVAATMGVLGSQSVLAENDGGRKTLALQSMPSIEVTAPDQSDASVAAQVREKIREQPSLKFFNIAVRSVNRAVYLEGQVDSNLDSSEAGQIVSGIPGVRKVRNHLYLNNS